MSLRHRESSFRRKVITAYEHRCAVTRIQLELIDAAHILPVGIEGSSDEVSNGLCLSPTYHRAFDRALIFLDESLVMQVNGEKANDLQQKGLAGGLHDFQRYLNQRIHLPPDRQQWPDVKLIREANQASSPCASVRHGGWKTGQESAYSADPCSIFRSEGLDSLHL